MLWTTSSNISVITNFGCRADCWYCIWKKHPLREVQLETDWQKLENFLHSNKEKGKVSVSGGGDCLYKYDEYEKWWQRFFKITDELNMKVDVHSREKFMHQDFWRDRINRCVFSSDVFSDDVDFFKYILNLTRLRITHLITSYTTNKLIEDYIEFSDEHNCQFTIKQLVGFDDMGRYKEIRNRYPNVFYLDEGDYNTYYMPDNSITDSFMMQEV
jgi:hypothetical protein